MHSCTFHASVVYRDAIMKVTYHGSDQLLHPGTLVQVMWLSGISILSHVFHEEVEINVASLALIQVIAKKIAEPQHALHLMWSKTEDFHHERPSGFQLLTHTRLVQVYCTLRDMWEEERGDIESADLQCCICLDPCEDADEYRELSSEKPYYSRETNCHRRKPCLLCSECHVRMPNGEWCCLDCVEASDINTFTWPSATLQRLRRVRPMWCLEELKLPTQTTESEK